MDNNLHNNTVNLPAAARTPGKESVQYMPVSLFGSTVAIAGLSIAWSQAGVLFGFSHSISEAIGVLAWGMFIFLTTLYVIKVVKFFTAVKAELTHPVTSNFLGTFFISSVLLSVIVADFSLPVARIVWCIGTAGGLVFMYALTSRAFRKQFSVLDAVPPALIPGLTLLNAVVASGKLKFDWLGEEISLILFSIGIMYVLTVFAIILFRLVYEEAISQFLLPTLLLMSAPFTVGASAYMSQVHRTDIFCEIFLFSGLFIFIVLFFRVFKKGLPFMTSWWSACFSIGALTNAFLKYSLMSDNVISVGIAGILLIAATLLMTITLAGTIRLQTSGRLMRA